MKTDQRQRHPSPRCQPEFHQWGFWTYSEPGSCRQQRECNRCQATETRPGPHTWGQWTYIDLPESWRQQRQCQRCPAEERRINQPDDPTEQLKLRLVARLQAGENIRLIFDELVAAAAPDTGRTIAQYQARATLSPALLQAIGPEVAGRLNEGELEGLIREELSQNYQDYVLFPDEWVMKVLDTAKTT